MTRGQRREALKKAIHESKNGKVTYALISANDSVITQDEDEAKTYVHTHGYRVYAKCKDGYMVL